MKTKMFKTSRMILLIVVLLIVVHVVWGQREHMSMNKDNSKNWDRPELSSVPEPTPEAADITSIKSRLTTVESDVSDLKSKVNK